MGYCETVCQLCGVSFAIARLRRADEPKEAAWSSSGPGFVDAGVLDELCGEGSGCTMPGFYGDRAGEHIAGPGCISENGYSGHRISVAEMKGCRAVQCLVTKDVNWVPEDDDQDFEVEVGLFLTGIGDGSPDEVLLEDIEPVTHGIDNLLLDNLGNEPDWGIPFHPTCFEIYKKVCEMRIGKVDTEGLYHWSALDCDYQTFFETFPRDLAVRRANNQWWTHEVGCEYLVANPIDIPGLSQFLELLVNCASKKNALGGSDRPDESRTENHRTPSSSPSAAKDPFSPLPAEITSMILDYLGSGDIANLRLTTPVFRQLPTILFRRLLLEDMPWLYEAKDLDVAKINWYDCYCTLKSTWMDLKGLRNRRRIWRDVEEIVRRIQNFRNEGKIGSQ